MLLPAAIAFAMGPNIVQNGKFHEPIIKQTPKGSLIILHEPGPCIIGHETY